LQSFNEDLAQAEEMAKKVAGQVEALKVELGAPSRVSKLEDATVSDGEGQRRKMMMVGGAGFGACLCCLLGVGMWEMRSRRIGTVEEVKKGLGMTIVGALPHLPGPGRGQPGGLESAPGEAFQQRLLTESVDATRTLLLNRARAEGTRTLMITSADSGEGKTSLAAQLAASLARAGYRTLLVDGDLRSPALHALFGLGVAPGLCEVLRVEAPLAEAVQPTTLAGLSFLPAGTWDGLALRALARERGRGLFEALKVRFDFVVVDSAPVLPVADSLLLAQHVDGVLFSLLRDVSRAPAVYAAQERIAMLGVRVLGAVVNGVRGDHGTPYRYSAPQAES
jgi:capsular exopolysaccharide synthesis family protein